MCKWVSLWDLKDHNSDIVLINLYTTLYLNLYSLHFLCLLAVLPETLHQLILVCAEVIWVSFIVTCSDVSIVVVQRLLFDVLILSSEHFMP